LQEEECPHTEWGKWTHVHEGYDARFCLNCLKEMEDRDGHFVVVRQLAKGYLFYADGKWSKSVKRATVFVGDNSYNEVYKEAYQKYAKGSLTIVRVMALTCFGNYKHGA
jgi:hypothetical protein